MANDASRMTSSVRILTKTSAFKAFLILAIAAALLAIASVGVTYSYFTTYATAKGTIELPLDQRTEIDEEFGDWTKSVTISNTAPAGNASSMTVFVRAKGFAGAAYPLVYSSDGSWTLGDDGYYYYGEPLAPGQTTSKLDVKITGVPEDAADDAAFNVVVVYETTPALYRADGTPYADWSDVLDTGQTGGGDAQ